VFRLNIHQLIYNTKAFFNFPYHYRRVKWFFHRGWYGWAPNDVWSFDHYLAKVISEGVARLKKNNIGCPSELLEAKDNYEWTDEEYELAEKKWDTILDQIIKGFRTYTEAEDCGDCGYGMTIFSKDPKHTCKKHDIEDYEKGWDLFRKYFMGLWD